MARSPKQSVGTCECPVRGCAHDALPVFKYEGSDDPAKRRFAGRLYLDCPEHGRNHSEYVLCNAKLPTPSQGHDAESTENHASDASSENPSPVLPVVTTTEPDQSKANSQKQSFFQRWSPIIQ